MMSRPSDWWVLELDRDPVPGAAMSVRSLARSWSNLADDAEWAETRVRQLMGDGAIGAWIGEAGDAFRSKTGDLPEQLGQCKDSYRLASEALRWWADRLDVHQNDADAALVKGRSARADLEAAQAQAAAAAAAVQSAAGSSVLRDARTAALDPALMPTPEQVRDARARLSSAQAAASSADSAVASAQARLDAARQLALDAASLRDGDAQRTASRIHEAADAGIPERSRWDKFKDWAGEAWDVVVTIAKVVVAVLGIVALIIGGPLAWVVFAAALLVLADSIMKYMQGRASLWDVAFSALACIPGTKGLTTLAALKGAFQTGGTLAAVAHVGSALRTAGVGLLRSAQRLRQGALPAVTAVVGEFRSASGWSGLRLAFGNGRRVYAQAIDVAWSAHLADVGATNPALAARRWQGFGRYPGVDDYNNVTLTPTTRMETGWPGLSGYAVPDGSAAAAGNRSSTLWESAQVGPSSAHANAYRDGVVVLEVRGSVPAAQGTALANPQYGAGGSVQYFLPDMTGAIASGDLVVLDAAGNAIAMPAGAGSGDVGSLIGDHLRGTGGPIRLVDPHPAPGIPYMEDVAASRPSPWTLIGRTTGYTWAGSELVDR
jgi:hypothetical protein